MKWGDMYEYCFQKGSPYIEDVNQLLGLAQQIGLFVDFDNFFQTSHPNVTKCSTWQDIQASHTAHVEKAVIKMKDIYGIMYLLIIGISGGLLLLLAEIFIQVMKRGCRAKARRQAWPVG